MAFLARVCLLVILASLCCLSETPPAFSPNTYHASAFEEVWTLTKRAGKLCATAAAQRDEAMQWMSYSLAVFNPKGSPARLPTDEEHNVLSYFLDNVTGRKEFIEPLSGIARHPLALAGVKCGKSVPAITAQYGGADIFDIRYLVTQNRCGLPGPKPHARLFDLGCTVYGGKKSRPSGTNKYAAGSGGGPSIPMFYTMFKDRCIEFDDIYAWEGKQYTADAWWAPVPMDIRSKLRFYNTFVKELSVKDSIDGKSAGDNSFLRMLKFVAKPEDYVVVKVDIDGGPELQIVEAIAARPELSSLVDEIFFEYHFYFDGNEFGWGGYVVRGSSVDTAISLMSRLRQAGVRSHFWI